MEQLLRSGMEVVVKSGFLYLPLLFDPDIVREISAPRDYAGDPAIPPVIRVSGNYFVKTLELASLAENYEKIYPQEFERHKAEFLQNFGPAAATQPLGTNLKTIIFQIMPHFLRRPPALVRRRLGDGEILDLIRQQLEVFPDFGKIAEDLAPPLAWHRPPSSLGRLGWEEPDEPPVPPEGGLMAAGELRAWLNQVLARKIWGEEKARLEEALKEQEDLPGLSGERRAVLLYLAAVGSLEVDGFGFTRLRAPDDYLIYRRTGQYALKDFYGRAYLFPDCRVAVSTMPPLKPVVLEKYKHPLLLGHAPGQAICVRRDFTPPRVFCAANAILALEEGINALFYNYDSRGRRGHHKLGTIKKPHQIMDFDDLKIPRDHPGIISGLIEIKNDFT